MPGILLREGCTPEPSCDSKTPSLHHRRFHIPLLIALPRRNNSRSDSPSPTSQAPHITPPQPAWSFRNSLSSSSSSSSLANYRQASPLPLPLPAFHDLRLHLQPEGDGDEETSDLQTWHRMLALQKQYHCYKSARMEAVIEVLERGLRVEDLEGGVPSRFCLALLNEELRGHIEGWREGVVG